MRESGHFHFCLLHRSPVMGLVEDISHDVRGQGDELLEVFLLQISAHDIVGGGAEVEVPHY